MSVLPLVCKLLLCVLTENIKLDSDANFSNMKLASTFSDKQNLSIQAVKHNGENIISNDPSFFRNDPVDFDCMG